MYGDIQHWHQLQKNFMPGFSPLQSPTASQCLSKVALSHSSELKLDWTELQVNSTELFHKLCLGKLSILLFHSTLPECTVKSMMINFQIPSSPPLSPLEYDKFFRSGRKDKDRSTGVRESAVQLSLCQPHSLHPFPSEKDENSLGEMAKRRGSTNKRKTFNLNCFNTPFAVHLEKIRNHLH